MTRLAHRSARATLQRIYGFDRWHVGHAHEPYAADIVRALNAWPATERQAVVEIGCGLGDILRHLHFRERLGLDRDAGALAAAGFLSRFQRSPRPRFESFEFPEGPLTGVYNAIVMVNWIHQIDPETLRGAVHGYAASHLGPRGGIVLDTVEDPAYDYAHDVQRLAWPGARVSSIGHYARGRRVWVLRCA